MSQTSYTALFQRKEDPSKGRHLIASQKISKGELIFVERPLLSLQTLGNAHEGALCCRCCRAFIGGPDLCIMITSGELSRDNVWEYYREHEVEICEEESFKMFPCRNECGELFCSEECERNMWCSCGHDLLCTGLIETPSENGTHNNLHPLLEFKIHAMKNNEIFIMVADLIATVVSLRRQQMEYNLKNATDATCNFEEITLGELMAPYLDFTMVPWVEVATAPLINDPMKMVECIELKKTLREMCDTSSTLLKHALNANTSSRHGDEIFQQTLTQALAEFESNFGISEDFFGKVIGSFEQNAMGIRARHPLCRDVLEDHNFRVRRHHNILSCFELAGMIGDYEEGGNGKELQRVEDTTGLEAENGIRKKDELRGHEYSADEITEFLAGLYIDEEGLTTTATTQEKYQDGVAVEEPGPTGDSLDALFVPLDGTCMYATACKMNHSCEPNVIARYRYSCSGGGKLSRWGTKFPLVLEVVALREIEEGEELCISYIANDADLQARQEVLVNYGFLCGCTKCLREKSMSESKGNVFVKDVQIDDNVFGVEDQIGEDLFGTDDESSAGGRIEDDESSYREMKLIDRLKELDAIAVGSPLGAIPISTLASALSFVNQLGSQILQDLTSHEQTESVAEVVRSMECLLEFVGGRDFFGLCRVATEGEHFTLSMLHKFKKWPFATIREAHGCFSVASAICFAQNGNFLPAIQMLDKASIFGLPRIRIRKFFQYVEFHTSQMSSSHNTNRLVPRIIVRDYSKARYQREVYEVGLPIPIRFPISEVSEGQFRSGDDSQLGAQPLVIRKYAKWPAKEKWRHLHLFLQKHGTRTIPIEHGIMSDKEGMQEEFMTMTSFILSYIAPSTSEAVCALLPNSSADSKSVAYLAQHQLFEQIPDLMDDIVFSDLRSKTEIIQMNTWIGTGGTRTPLHFDTYDNLFVQLVGTKYIRLYDKKETPKLYVIKEGFTSYARQGNMSAVDCEKEDYLRHPLAESANYTEVVLFPGDALYIPAKTWHYVRGLSTSISVNFWW